MKKKQDPANVSRQLISIDEQSIRIITPPGIVGAGYNESLLPGYFHNASTSFMDVSNS